MTARRASQRLEDVRVAVLSAALLAGRGMAQGAEDVVADVDLAGWHDLGAVVVEAEGLAPDEALLLLDDNPSTVARSRQGPVSIRLLLRPAQVVQEVALRPGAAGSYAVRLTVEESDGSRFAAGEAVVEAGGEAIFRMLDAASTGLAFEIERLDESAAGSEPLALVEIADLRVRARLRVDALALEAVPPTLPEGGSFPIRIRGHDALGGRPDLTDIAQLVITPARALAMSPEGRAVTRIGGPIDLAPRLGALTGPRQSVLVIPLESPPPPPEALAGVQVVNLTLAGQPPLAVLRRNAGEKDARVIGVARRASFLDDDVEPGAAYQYAVRRIDALGNPLTPPSAETRVRTLAREPAGYRLDGRLPVLIAVFTDTLAVGEAEAIAESLESARLFLWRHSGGRALLDFTWLAVPGPTPPTDGPNMAGIEQRLRALGVADDEFGTVFAISNELAGGWGGLQLLGRTAGALGRWGEVPTPRGALGPDPAVAWSFVHEMQHVFDGPLATSAGYRSLSTGHPEQDVPAGRLGSRTGRLFDAGEAWDAQAALLGSFGVWDEIAPPYRRQIETIDSDADGLPDDDPRYPLDERRLRSDPFQPDSDGDGLSDLGELAAGLYEGSHPLRPDTDGDGRLDGDDDWPLSDFVGRVQRGSVPRRLATLPSAALELLACWNEEGLVLEIVTDDPCDVFLDLDGSGGLGRWESDVTTGSVSSDGAGPAALRASDVYAGAARLALRSHETPRGVFVGSRPVPGAHVRSERLEGRWHLRAELPAALGPGATDVFIPPGAAFVEGLRLHAGTVLGLSLTVRPSRRGDPRPFECFARDGSWTSLFETHRLYDAVLLDD